MEFIHYLGLNFSSPSCCIHNLEKACGSLNLGFPAQDEHKNNADPCACCFITSENIGSGPSEVPGIVVSTQEVQSVLIKCAVFYQ